jgi:mannose-6-phosphate isomerase-like protein (cupin superfamily)
MTSARPAGAIVQADQVPAEAVAGGASVRTLLDTGRGEPGLIRRHVDMQPGTGYDGTAGAAGELWFVIRGTGKLEVAGQPGPALRPDRAVWVPAGSDYRVLADDETDVRLDVVALPIAGASEAAAAEQASQPLQDKDFADCEIETTGDRQFRVLFGPGKGCSVATQFVGEIPPGRAPEHSHPYDEVVLILGGEGTAHIGGAQTPLSPGTCLHLPPGLPHCLENSGSAMLRVLGVFHPADSPAAKLPQGN